MAGFSVNLNGLKYIQDALKGPTSSSNSLINLYNEPWYNGNGMWNKINGGPTDAFYEIKSFENKIYVGGAFDNQAKKIAVYDLTTNIWSPLGSGFDYPDAPGYIICFSIAISPDGTNVYAGGEFTLAGGMLANYIAVWNTITNTWSPLGSGLNNICRSIAISSNGTNLYAGGDFTQEGCNYIAVYDLITNTWSPLGSGLNATCWDIAISPDGTNVYVCGSFTLAGGISANRIAVWNTITNTWSPFGSGLNAICFSLSLLNSHIYVTGNFLVA